jgi:hypothetical protein
MLWLYKNAGGRSDQHMLNSTKSVESSQTLLTTWMITNVDPFDMYISPVIRVHSDPLTSATLRKLNTPDKDDLDRGERRCCREDLATAHSHDKHHGECEQEDEHRYEYQPVSHGCDVVEHEDRHCWYDEREQHTYYVADDRQGGPIVTPDRPKIGVRVGVANVASDYSVPRADDTIADHVCEIVGDCAIQDQQILLILWLSPGIALQQVILEEALASIRPYKPLSKSLHALRCGLLESEDIASRFEHRICQQV